MQSADTFIKETLEEKMELSAVRSSNNFRMGTRAGNLRNAQSHDFLTERSPAIFSPWRVVASYLSVATSPPAISCLAPPPPPPLSTLSLVRSFARSNVFFVFGLLSIHPFKSIRRSFSADED